jgi:catechol 2,3-dioxygenase-like lactoylglutathione lyase family enzyme
MAERKKVRAVGLNHVALEVGDIEEAPAFYGQLFDFKIRGKSGTSAFVDLGDQFLALQKGRTQPADDGRHFGLVVDDRDAVRKALADVGIKPLPGPFLDFLDPWGNRIEIVSYENVQFTKAPNRHFGLHSRASFCALVICFGVMRLAIASSASIAPLSSASLFSVSLARQELRVRARDSGTANARHKRQSRAETAEWRTKGVSSYRAL